MNKDVMFSSGDTTGTSEWQTPDTFFGKLVKRFRKFTLDPAATKRNAKAAKFFTVKEDGLAQPWKAANVFVNPPYGRALKNWVRKAMEETIAGNAKQIVMLLPARTDTKWFHEFVVPYAREVLFLKGRLTFEVPGSNGDPAPFPNMVVVFDRDPIWFGHCMFGVWAA